MFIFNTDQGYISGTLHQNLRFQCDKSKARRFTPEQIKAFGDGIAADLHDYYSCEWVHIELI
jgi:hypothetical protein